MKYRNCFLIPALAFFGILLASFSGAQSEQNLQNKSSSEYMCGKISEKIIIKLSEIIWKKAPAMFFKDRNTRFATDYQYGEEPKGKKTEVLTEDLLCFHDEQVNDFFKQLIKEILEIDGLAGIGFDYFGYQNYRCCMCDVSEKAFTRYMQHAGLQSNISIEKAREKFSLESLISFYNQLSDYARSIKPDGLTKKNFIVYQA